MTNTQIRQKELQQQEASKTEFVKAEMRKLGISAEQWFLWRVEVMVEFSRKLMFLYDFRQSILGEKAYTECLLRHVIKAEYNVIMSIVSTEDEPTLNYAKYENVVMIMLNKANTTYIINECIALIIHDRKLKEKKWKNLKK
jgi:hypothetical protein